MARGRASGEIMMAIMWRLSAACPTSRGPNFVNGPPLRGRSESIALVINREIIDRSAPRRYRAFNRSPASHTLMRANDCQTNAFDRLTD